MTEFYEFCRDVPWLALVLILVVFFLIRMAFRSINIWLRGWPPPHVDADGDIHSTTPDTDET